MLLLSILMILRTPTVTDLTKDTFFDFTSRDGLISVVHFYGRQCPACDDAEGTFEELSRMYWQEWRVKFGQLDCDRASDVCDTVHASNRPVWLAWIPGETVAKRYNRDINTDMFERWIRQQTGIWPPAKARNLLYINKTDVEAMKKRKTQCLFTIIDTPRMDASQNLHNQTRTLEKKVITGAKFFAIDQRENPLLSKKLLENDKYAGFLFNKNKWTKYTGKEDTEEIMQFMKKNNCRLQIATPTPTPEPLPELEDLPDEEFIPLEDNEEEVQNEAHEEKQNDEEDNEDDENHSESDWEI